MLKLLFRLMLLVLFIPFVMVIVYKWVNPPTTFIQQSQSNLRGNKGDWVTLKEIPDDFERAIVAAEDEFFFSHRGFDWEAIERAWEYNKSHKSKLGGSTISQQTAKNVFLWESRTWLRKGLEAYFTFLIEQIWGKARIMEVYINVIEMGRGAFGIDEASAYYFQKSPQRLTKTQSVQIVSMLPCPRTCGINHPLARKRQKRIFYAMQHYGIKLEYE